MQKQYNDLFQEIYSDSHPRAMLNAGDTKTNFHINLVLEEPIAIHL